MPKCSPVDVCQMDFKNGFLSDEVVFLIVTQLKYSMDMKKEREMTGSKVHAHIESVAKKYGYTLQPQWIWRGYGHKEHVRLGLIGILTKTENPEKKTDKQVPFAGSGVSLPQLDISTPRQIPLPKSSPSGSLDLSQLTISTPRPFTSHTQLSPLPKPKENLRYHLIRQFVKKR